MNSAVDPSTGEIVDAAAVFARLRDLDFEIVQADELIDLLKDRLRSARQHRENLVSELRAAARGDRALPFDESKPPTREGVTDVETD